MSHTILLYVDKELCVQLVTGMLGSEIHVSKQDSTAHGINFKVMLNRTSSTEKSVTTRIENLLPELVAQAAREATPTKITSLSEARAQLMAGANGAIPTGTPALITDVNFEEADHLPGLFGGEHCVPARISGQGSHVRAFLNERDGSLLEQVSGQPVDVLGVLRYTPPYAVPGGIAISLGLRVCAVWLR